jgi:hypothetical protein
LVYGFTATGAKKPTIWLCLQDKNIMKCHGAVKDPLALPPFAASDTNGELKEWVRNHTVRFKPIPALIMAGDRAQALAKAA